MVFRDQRLIIGQFGLQGRGALEDLLRGLHHGPESLGGGLAVQDLDFLLDLFDAQRGGQIVDLGFYAFQTEAKLIKLQHTFS